MQSSFVEVLSTLCVAELDISVSGIYLPYNFLDRDAFCAYIFYVNTDFWKQFMDCFATKHNAQ